MIKIGLASDHAGFELKEFVKKYIEQKGYIYKDFGAYTADSSDRSEEHTSESSH